MPRAELLDEHPVIPAAAARIGADVAGALASRHRQGTWNGRLTPATVWLDPDGGAPLHDPHLRRATASPPAPTSRSRAPCPIWHRSRWLAGRSAHTDVYALGLVVLEAVTGLPACPGTSWEAATARLTGLPESPTPCPAPCAGAPLGRPSRSRPTGRLAAPEGLGAPTARPNLTPRSAT